jgi:hypothetical protein
MRRKSRAEPSSQESTDQRPLFERVAERAYALYEQRGRLDGFDAEDWAQAEQEILSQVSGPSTPAPSKKRPSRPVKKPSGRGGALRATR